MGNVTTSLGRKLSRPLKNFAVEARAEKVISKDKPVPAPWHPATQRKIDEIIKGKSSFFLFQEKVTIYSL